MNSYLDDITYKLDYYVFNEILFNLIIYNPTRKIYRILEKRHKQWLLVVVLCIVPLRIVVSAIISVEISWYERKIKLIKLWVEYCIIFLKNLIQRKM